jgi:hypothetical protein
MMHALRAVRHEFGHDQTARGLHPDSHAGRRIFRRKILSR